MAMLVKKSGLLRDRTKGYAEISYYLPNNSLSYMRDCKKAHELIVALLPEDRRKKITGKKLRKLVMQYVSINIESRKRFLSELLFPKEKEPEPVLLTMLVNSWVDGKLAEGSDAVTIKFFKRVINDFFSDNKLVTVKDLSPDTAGMFIKWRTVKTYGYHKGCSSANTIKNELGFMKQIAKYAYLHEYIKNGNIWDNAKVKIIVGQNKRIVYPLSVEEQKNLLHSLYKERQDIHDVCLFLLLTGLRAGELENVKPASFRNNILNLFGDYIGKDKSGGKSISASRNIPLNPTLLELVKRGNIFNTSINAVKIYLKRNFKGIHAHRLRHTFATNKLLAQVPLQMVSYQMGHSSVGITSDLYGKFEPRHFKAGFEEAIAERQTLLQWLEHDYFGLKQLRYFMRK